MPALWTLEEFDAHDPTRAAHLRQAPPWLQLIEAAREKLRTAINTRTARFGLDESSRDHRELRGTVQFPLGRSLFDWFFNGTTGYRAQFRIGRGHGLAMNALLMHKIAEELRLSAATGIVIHRFTFEFAYKDSTPGTIGQIASTLDPELSKAWLCERRIEDTGGIQELFISRTGPKLVFPQTNAWSSLYPEDADGWLDVKGAFAGQAGPYQIKSPEERATGLEERGTA